MTRAHAHRLSLWLALALLAPGCGVRTGLGIDGPAADGGTLDASIDGGFGDGDVDGGPLDGDVRDLAQPDFGVDPGMVRCEAEALAVLPGELVQLHARHGVGLEGAEGAWRFVSSPTGDFPVITPSVGRDASFSAAAVGLYDLLYELRDAAGDLQRCSLEVEVLPIPPVPVCPTDAFVVLRGESLSVVASATDDEEVTSMSWAVTSQPMGAGAVLIELAPGTAQFSANAPGAYQLTFTATDNAGLSASCAVDVRVSAPPVLACPSGPVPAVSQQRVSVEVSATDDRQVVTQAWQVVSQPPAANITLSPATGARTSFVPPRKGDYALRFTATDDDGLSSSCDVLVQAVNAPPAVMCPAPVRGVVNTDIPVLAQAMDDEGVVRVQWTLVSGPAGATTGFTDATAPSTGFRSNRGGLHTLRFEAFDGDGASASCMVEVTVLTPPEVVCPASPVAAETRSPVTLMASVMDDGMIVSTTWTMLQRPAQSTVDQGPFPGESVTFTPDRVGDYALEFVATDDDGLSSACQVTVQAAPSEPVLSCPAVVTVRPLRVATVEATLVAADAPLTTIQWSRVSYPAGSTAADPAPANQLVTQLTPDIVGDYPIHLDVEDGNGFQAGCDVLVRAVSDEGLRVELFWTSLADMDIHVMDPAGTRWFTNLDCYYANCRNGLPWGGPLTEDNPRLDIDDTNGFGPENINIQVPVPGVYRVAVDAYRGGGNVSVRIYCGGSVTVPVATFGPTSLPATGWMWRVADVDIRGPGDCSVTTLGAPTNENIENAPR
ncbi:MAG: PKD domain-containing protein [Polyangiales bacterium]